MAERGAPGGSGGGDSGAVRDAVYAAIESAGRAEIARELGAGGRGSGGPVCAALRAAAGRAGLPDPRACTGGGYDEEAAAAVITTMLHYLLSAAAVPSQRRVAVGGVDVDIAVPDAAALQPAGGASTPATPSAVVVCIVGMAGGPAAERRTLEVAAAARPARENLWIAGWSRDEGAAAGAAAGAAGRTYLASDCSLASLVPDLALFAASAAARGGRRRLCLTGATPGSASGPAQGPAPAGGLRRPAPARA